MLKRKKDRRPTDPNQLMRRMVEETTGETVASESEPTQDEISRVMALLGRRGGKIGGKRRMKTMTRAERVAVAKQGAKKRWDNARKASQKRKG
jgi:hypothetical protein